MQAPRSHFFWRHVPVLFSFLLILASCSSNISPTHSTQNQISQEEIDSILLDILNLNCDKLNIGSYKRLQFVNSNSTVHLDTPLDLENATFILATARSNELADENQLDDTEFPSLYEITTGTVNQNNNITLNYATVSRRTALIAFVADPLTGGRRLCTDLFSFDVASRHNATFIDEYNNDNYMKHLDNVIVENGHVQRSGGNAGFDPFGQYASDVVAHWSFNDDLSDNTADESTGNYPATCNGDCPTYQAGDHFGGSYHFANDHLNAGTFDVTGNQLTIAGWMRADNFNTPDGRIITKSTGVQEDHHYFMLSTIYDSGYKARFRLKTNNQTSTLIADSGNLQTGTWHHIGATYNGSQMCLYVDGNPAGCKNKSGNITGDGSVPVLIGENPNNETSFAGSLDDIFILKIALTAQQMQEIAANGAPGTFESLPVRTIVDQDMYDLKCSWQESVNGNTSFAVSFDGGVTYTTIPNGGFYPDDTVFPTNTMQLRAEVGGAGTLDRVRCDWSTDEPPPPQCGNDILESGEECDGSDDTACPGQCLADCTCGDGGGQGGIPEFCHVVAHPGGGDMTTPWGKETADIDGDGKDDLIVGAQQDGDSLAWFKHQPAGSNGPCDDGFVKHTIATEGDYTTDISGVDLNNDGKTDIVTGQWSFDNIQLFVNLGGNPVQWTNKYIVPNSVRAHDISVGKINNQLIIVTRDQKNYGDAIRIYRRTSMPDPNNPNTWTWASPQVFTSGLLEGEGLGLDDIDNDGTVDVISGTQILFLDFVNNSIVVDAMTNIDTDFRKNDPYTNTVVDVADINDDGRPDIGLAPAEWDGDEPKNLSVFLNPTNPRTTTNWQEMVVEPDQETIHHAFEFDDFNNDGMVDVASAEMPHGGGTDHVKVYINLGNGAFEKVVAYTCGSHAIRTGDFDGDGNVDIMGANPSSGGSCSSGNGDGGKINAWMNKGTPKLSLDSWQRHVIGTAPGNHKNVLIDIGQLNNDSLLDIATGPNVYINPGSINGNWTVVTPGDPLNNIYGVVDLNNDGKAELFGARFIKSSSESTDYYLSIAQNLGGQTPSFNVITLDNINQTLTNDGRDEDFLQGIAIDTYSGSLPQIAISWHYNLPLAPVHLLKHSGNPFNQASWLLDIINDNTEYEDLTNIDINGDGKPDIITGHNYERNNGNDFTTVNYTQSCNVPSGLGDIDRNAGGLINSDNRVDIAFAEVGNGAPGIVGWCEQLPNNQWTYHAIATVTGPQSMNIADMDNDGDLDVVVGEHDTQNPSTARIFVFENVDGNGTSWSQHLVHTGDEHHDGALIGDLDGDGDKDIASIGFTHGNVIVYEHKGID